MQLIKRLFLVLILMNSLNNLFAQSNDKLKVYLECNQQWLCDMDFLRNEMTAVDFVRDRFLCDIQIISNVQFTNGGESNTLRFMGQKAYEGKLDTITYYNDVTATDDIKRKKMLKNIQLTLIPYLMKLNQTDDIEVTIKSNATSTKKEDKKDPYNLWQFTIGSSGFFDGDKNYSSANINNNISAGRETSKNKFILEIFNNINRNRFVIFREDGSVAEKIPVKNDRQGAFARYTKKLNEHWGLGLQSNFRRSVFDNIDLSIGVLPQIEYSFSPYSKFNDQRFIISYGIGARHQNYRDTTIYLKTKETLMRHSISAVASVTKPWGTLNLGADWSNYFDDWAKNNFSLQGSVSWNIFQGFKFSVGGSFEVIHDQISLPKLDASRDDLLTKRRLIATSYQYFGGVGFSYTFGSIFNSQVNPTFRGLNWGLNF
jgi:hypothetical protein